MRGRSGWLVIGAAAVLSLTAVASEKAPESYVKNMKDTNAEAAVSVWPPALLRSACLPNRQAELIALRL